MPQTNIPSKPGSRPVIQSSHSVKQSIPLSSRGNLRKPELKGKSVSGKSTKTESIGIAGIKSKEQANIWLFEGATEENFLTQFPQPPPEDDTRYTHPLVSSSVTDDSGECNSPTQTVEEIPFKPLFPSVLVNAQYDSRISPAKSITAEIQQEAVSNDILYQWRLRRRLDSRNEFTASPVKVIPLTTKEISQSKSAEKFAQVDFGIDIAVQAEQDRSRTALGITESATQFSPHSTIEIPSSNSAEAKRNISDGMDCSKELLQAIARRLFPASDQNEVNNNHVDQDIDHGKYDKLAVLDIETDDPLLQCLFQRRQMLLSALDRIDRIMFSTV